MLDEREDQRLRPQLGREPLGRVDHAAVAAVHAVEVADDDEPAARVSGEGQDSTAAWTALDPVNDGSLSVDELEQQRAMGLMQDWANVDTDGDGRISRTEWDAWWPRMTDHYVRENGGNEVAFDSVR